MNNDQDIEDLQLYAFIDDELDEQECAILLAKLEHSSEIEKRLSNYRKVKDLVKHAYSSLPPPRRTPVSIPVTSRKPNTFFMSGLLLVLGCFIGGLLTHLVSSGSVSKTQPLQVANTTFNAVSDKRNHFLLHLASDNTAAMTSALDRAETLVMNSSKLHPTTVEVIANFKGINLLKSDTSPFKERIAELASKHVLFIACARRIENLLETNQSVHLLPEAEYRYTAVERIVGGLQNGATYEKIEI